MPDALTLPLDRPVEILLVEDNPADIELTLHAFERKRFVNNIHVVHDGAEALDFLFARGAHAGRDCREVPRLILLDLKLPRVSGAEVLRRIRSDPCTRLVPVVVLTSSREEKDIAECYRLGANSYLVKPVEFEKFTEIVEQVGHYWLLINQSSSNVERTADARLPGSLLRSDVVF